MIYFWKNLTFHITHVCSLWQGLSLGIKKLTLWPWPWLLTYFWKNLTLALPFELKEIGLSYYTWIFLVARPFCLYQIFDPVTLTSLFDLLLKKLNLGINFWTERDPKKLRKLSPVLVFVICKSNYIGIPLLVCLSLCLEPIVKITADATYSLCIILP